MGLLLVLAAPLAGNAWAQPADATTSAAELLTSADAAVDAGELEAAESLYTKVIREHGDTAEGSAARRALKILRKAGRPTMAGGPAPAAGPEATPGAAAPGGDDVVMRREPYSLRTQERLRLTTWEKTDFCVTAFLYGASVGVSYSLAADEDVDFPAPMAAGALAYTLGALAYLGGATPDRGDLPLVLAISSYLPTTTLLFWNIASDNTDTEDAAVAVAVTGTLALPLAGLAAHRSNLDPGDAQLVRDAGFWGLVLATAGTMGFGGKEGEFGYGYQSPSTRMVSVAGLSGLYGGLTLGLVGALSSEVSLERVRVSTWGGYGGAVLGLLMGAAMGSEEHHAYQGLGIGGAFGLGLTFLVSAAMDGIPADARLVRTAMSMGTRIEPTIAALPAGPGSPQSLALGLRVITH